jgi:hypothetical protein
MLHPLVHGVSGILLLTSHGIFLFRGLAMRKTGGRPGNLDRTARFISHFGLPLAIGTGFLVKTPDATAGFPSSLHLVLGLLPLAAVIGFTPFLPLRRRVPWLLPGINLVLFAAAAASGILLRRVLK